jgi:hypothetical protein
MKMLPHEVHPASRSFRTALFIVACVTAASACGGADFEVAGLDGGPDGNMELDAHKKDGRVEETGAHDAGRKDTGAKDSGGHADGTSGLDASLDAPDDVGPNQDGVAPGDAAGDAPHDAIVTNDGPKACPGAAMSCTTSSSMCPLSNFPECAPSTCDQGCCKTTVAQAGTACTEMGGSVCNGMGAGVHERRGVCDDERCPRYDVQRSWREALQRHGSMRGVHERQRKRLHWHDALLRLQGHVCGVPHERPVRCPCP